MAVNEWRNIKVNANQSILPNRDSAHVCGRKPLFVCVAEQKRRNVLSASITPDNAGNDR